MVGMYHDQLFEQIPQYSRQKRPIPSVYSLESVIPIQALIQPIISQVQFSSSFFSFLNEWEEERIYRTE